MSNREPVSIVEIDVDFCTRTFGTLPCTAALGGSVKKKCFNTTATCNDRVNLNLGTLTLSFIEARSAIPKDKTYFPCLISVGGSSSSVNIGGADKNLNALGKRASKTFKFMDFPYHDRLTDKYQTERVSGAAQLSGIGYRPESQGTFFGRLRARWPFYAGRALRHKKGFIDGGVFTLVSTSYWIITDMQVNKDQTVEIETKDILDLADNSRAIAPKLNSGVLAANITDSATTLTLSPAGIGNLEYPTSGKAVVGSEMVEYTRAGDVVTLTARGSSGTKAASHSANDSFQQTFSCFRARVDDTIKTLLVDYAGINPAFLPLTKWAAEVNRWAPTLRLTIDVTKPEGVASLIGELAVLGITIGWDEELQEIFIKMVRPPDTDVVKEISDFNALEDIYIEDRSEDRLTQVAFYTVIVDPTKSATDGNNYSRQRLLISADAQSSQEYNDVKVREVFCRWLNHGDDAAVRILGRRLLQMFKRQPVRFVMTVDIKDNMKLADVCAITSRAIEAGDGSMVRTMAQIIQRDDVKVGKSVKLIAQKFPFDGRLAYVTENSRPTYPSSSEAQKLRGAYFCNNATRRMSDGSDPYRFN